jgi:AcrR family transcriptional regulator
MISLSQRLLILVERSLKHFALNVNICRVILVSAAGNKDKPKRGRRPGPSSTREDVLRAARRRFAREGYDRATFRNIAADAGVDPALVVQFFGNKQELFVAATTSPVTLAELSQASDHGGPAEAGLRLARLLVRWLEDETAREAMIGRLRAAATEPTAAELVRQMIEGQITAFARLMAGDHPDVRASLLATQFLGVVWARFVVHLEPLASMTGDELAAWLGPTFQLYLDPPVETAT